LQIRFIDIFLSFQLLHILIIKLEII